MELIDEVMFDFPELVFVTRHGCEPWTELAVKLMLKWPGLHYSTSAFAPKYYPKDIVDYANTRGADKIIYAGYFPMGLSMERIMTEMLERRLQGRGVAQIPPHQRPAGPRPRRRLRPIPSGGGATVPPVAGIGLPSPTSGRPCGCWARDREFDRGFPSRGRVGHRRRNRRVQLGLGDGPYFQLLLLGGPGPPIHLGESPQMYSALLGALAARTERIQLGTLVTGHLPEPGGSPSWPRSSPRLTPSPRAGSHPRHRSLLRPGPGPNRVGRHAGRSGPDVPRHVHR